MANVLITGARSAAALELSRAFHQDGHRVFLADDEPASLASYSSSVAKSYVIPSAETDEEGFLDAVRHLAEEEAIDLILSGSDETEALARLASRLKTPTRILAPSLSLLHELRDRFRFVAKAKALGLPAPETLRLTSQEDLVAAFAKPGEWVFKPLFAGTGSPAILRPASLEALKEIRPSADRPWVAQRFLRGKLFRSYSLAHYGVLSAHVTYPVELGADQSSASATPLAMVAVDHGGIFEWVRQFAKAYSVHGHLSVDFVEGPDGTVHAVDCSAQVTSGIHLFPQGQRLAKAFLRPQSVPYCPPPGFKALRTLAFLVRGIPRLAAWQGLRQWLTYLRDGRDVYFRRRDMMPALMNVLGMFRLGHRGHRSRGLPFRESGPDVGKARHV
jgi:hypothetical protein